jgi:TorA maturation chaperone TorD
MFYNYCTNNRQLQLKTSEEGQELTLTRLLGNKSCLHLFCLSTSTQELLSSSSISLSHSILSSIMSRTVDSSNLESVFSAYYKKFQRVENVKRGEDADQVEGFATLLQKWSTEEEEILVPLEQITIRCKYLQLFLKKWSL